MNQQGNGGGWFAKLLFAALSSPVVIALLNSIVGRKNDEQLAEIRAEFSKVNARLSALEFKLDHTEKP